MENEQIRETVKRGYGEVAACGTGCCGGSPNRAHAVELGYDEEALREIPEDANLGLGCGNPTAIAELQPGQVVLDLGSGAGMDAFLAASKVGDSGQVIGVDMTPEMLARARNLAAQRGVSHFVEFRRGLIEELPVVDESVDVILSNCVINLSVEKEKVFSEAFRVLKPGGRVAISDICLSEELPASVLGEENAYTACISGALLFEEYRRIMEEAGFVEIEATRSDAGFLLDGACADPLLKGALEGISEEDLEAARAALWSYKFTARKP